MDRFKLYRKIMILLEFLKNKIKPRKGRHENELVKKGQEFSKTLLIQESILIWIHTLAMLALAYICVFQGYYAELPWLTAMTSLPWAAYAISQHAYYKKAESENTQGGIIYESAKWDHDAVG